MKWFHKLLFSILISAFIAASYICEGNYFRFIDSLEFAGNKYAGNWIYIYPSIGLPLAKFLMLLFAALKNIITKSQINYLIKINIAYKAIIPCISGIFYILYCRFTGNISIHIILFNIFMAVLWLGGPISIKIILNRRENN